MINNEFESTQRAFGRLVGWFFCFFFGRWEGLRHTWVFGKLKLKFLVIGTWNESRIEVSELVGLATEDCCSIITSISNRHPWPRCQFELWDGDTHKWKWGKTHHWAPSHRDSATMAPSPAAPTVEISEGLMRFLPLLQDPKPPLLPCSFVKWMSRKLRCPAEKKFGADT